MIAPLQHSVSNSARSSGADVAASLDFLPPAGGDKDHQCALQAFAGCRDAIAAAFGVPRRLLGNDVHVRSFPQVFPNFSGPANALKQRKINSISCVDRAVQP